MRLAWVENHRNAAVEWSQRGVDDWLTDIFVAPALKT